MTERELGQREAHGQQHQRKSGRDDEPGVGPGNDIEHGKGRDRRPDEQNAPGEHRRARAGAAFSPQHEDQDIAEQDNQAEQQPGNAGSGGRLIETVDGKPAGCGAKNDQRVSEKWQPAAQFEKGHQAEYQAGEHQTLNQRPDLLAALGTKRQPTQDQRQISRLDGEETGPQTRRNSEAARNTAF